MPTRHPACLVLAAAALAACRGGPPVRVPMLPLPPYVEVPDAPAARSDSVEVAVAADERAVSAEDQAARGHMRPGAAIVIHVGDAGSPSRLAVARRQAEMTLLRGGFTVIDPAAFGADRLAAGAPDGDPLAALIATARGEGTTADYVLNLQRLAVLPAGDWRIEVTSRPEVQAFLQRNPGLELPASVAQPELHAELDAQLIDARSGALVWTATDSRDSRDAVAGGSRVRISCTRTPANTRQVLGAIEAYNAQVDETERACSAAHGRYVSALDRGAGSEEIDAARREFEDSATRLRTMMPPEALREVHWKYDYTVSTTVEPDLNEEAGASSELVPSRHEVRLIRHLVTRLLASLPTQHQ